MVATDEDLARLRRRVYSPDATEEDRRRYAEALAAGSPAARSPAAGPDSDEEADAGGPAAPPGSPSRRPTRRAVIVGAAAIAAVAAGAVGLALLRPAGPAGPAPEQLPVTADERDTFVNALVIGTDAGIAAYLLTHPGPAALRNADPVDVVEQRGVGPTDLLLLSGPDVHGSITVDGRTGQTVVPPRGRITVLLVTAQAGQVGWALETSVGDGRRVIARRGGFQSAGSLTSATIAYATAAGRPDRVRIDVPSGVPWGVAALYTD